MTGSVRCPDCGALIQLPEGTRSGDVVQCPNCAGHLIRVRQNADGWSATLAHRVSCPACDEMTTLPEDAKPGDTIRCCGRAYRLTFEYGAFAAEESEEDAR
jgi:ssDNA-binding Zn-finger/Zn-ribbon topoisomerase 1